MTEYVPPRMSAGELGDDHTHSRGGTGPAHAGANRRRRGPAAAADLPAAAADPRISPRSAAPPRELEPPPSPGAIRCPTGVACSGCRYCETAREAAELELERRRQEGAP